jgi:LL-diaminopimelate aminotransferase
MTTPAKTLRSDRLNALPPFLFDEIDRKKRERIAAGANVINLGVGDPDKPTPEFIVDAMNEAMRELVNQQYPAVGGGLRIFRDSVARFMKARFGVNVDPMKHVVALLGSKDGIAHLPWAVTNPGDLVCFPDPAYPVYEVGSVLASCRTHKMPVSRESGWKPRFDAIPQEVARAARICWVNYPSNPTAAGADVAFYERMLEWTQPTWAGGGGSRGCIAASDLAYSELFFGDANKPVSLWQARNANINETMAIEFHSLSKTFNMTGWRIGFAVGHESIISALASIKANVDSGTFNAIQAAGAVALDRYNDPAVEAMRKLYQRRRDVIVPGLRAIGCEVEEPPAGFFVWARTPPAPGRPGERVNSMTFAARLLEQADTVVVPGAGFSPERGRDWFRIALTVEAERMGEAVDRMRRIDWTH